MTRTILMAASALALLAAGPAAAMQTQTDAAEPAAAPVDDAASAQPEGKPLPDGTTPEERANTTRLNAEQAASAKAENIAYDQQVQAVARERSEEHTSELQSLMRTSYAVFCLKKKQE